MRTRFAKLIGSLLAVWLTVPGQLSAQNAPAVPAGISSTRPPRLEPDRSELERLSTSRVRTRFAADSARRKGDSLVNGAVIGAILGAAVFGTFAAVICKATQEPEGPSCIPDTLRIAAIGGAIGAGGGLAIDAARSRAPGVRMGVAVRF